MARLVGLTLLLLCCCPAVAAAAQPPVNVTRPVIDDTTPVVGDTLHATPGEWDDLQATVAYQWLACDGDGKACADIPDATSDSYTVLASDSSKRLQVRTIATNADGESVPSDSLLTGVVLDVVPEPDPTVTPEPTATATAEPTATATAEPTATATAEPTPTATATATAEPTATTTATAEPTATATTTATPPPTAVRNVAPPAITGLPVVGNTLVSSFGRWEGTPPFLITRRWQRCFGDESTCIDIPLRVSDTYTVQPADVGNRLRVIVKASNDGGSATAASALFGPLVATAAGTTAQVSPAPPLGVAFDGRPRRAALAKALARKLKLRADCTGPCRVVVRLTVSSAVARKWRIPRTVATGTRARAGAGTAIVRPHFAKKTRTRLRRVRKLVVVVTAQGRDGAGTLASQRSWKLTLTR